MLAKFTRNSRNLFILGAVLAIVAFGLAFKVLSSAQSGGPTTLAARGVAAPPTPPPAPVLVVKAKSGVPAFSQIADPQTAMQNFTSTPYDAYTKQHGTPPADYVKGEAGLADLLTPAGGGARHLAFSLTQNSPLLASELLTSTVPGTVDYSTMLQKGEVAEAVTVQPTAAGNGSIQVGDHVDLLATYKVSMSETPPGLPGIDLTQRIRNSKPDSYGTWQTQTVIENLRVLSVSGANYVVAMKPQDAVILKWVKDSGGVMDLTVRAAGDIDKNQNAKPFTTKPVLPSYMLNSLGHKNNFKQS